MYLITPSLLNSFEYYAHFEGEASGEGDGFVAAEEKEAAVRREFLQTLSREKFAPNEAMQKGIEFENRVYAYCQGAVDDNNIIQEISGIVKGGAWQQRISATLDGFLLYGKTDVIKRDTVYDLKRSKSYEVGKYQKSAQHRIYLYCSKLPRFSYLISDDRSWWAEDYFNHDGIEGEIRQAIRQFIGYLENDPEARALYYDKWKAKGAQAA